MTIPLLLEVHITHEHAQELVLCHQPLAGRIKAASFPPCEQICGLFQYFIASNLKPVIVKLLSFCPSNIHLRQTNREMYAIIYEKYLMSILGHFIKGFPFSVYLVPLLKLN